jgi:hypothetical protein
VIASTLCSRTTSPVANYYDSAAISSIFCDAKSDMLCDGNSATNIQHLLSRIAFAADLAPMNGPNKSVSGGAMIWIRAGLDDCLRSDGKATSQT